NSHRWPELLPDGKAMLFAAFVSGRNWNEARIMARTLATGEQRELLQGGTYPRYVSSGYLVYARNGTLMAAPFDADRLTLKGSAVPVVEGVLEYALSGSALYTLSASGTLVYVPGSGQENRVFARVDRDGTEHILAAPPRMYRNPRLSPDGRSVAVAIEE